MVRTKISSLFGKITVLVIICCCCLPAYAKYGGGSGTAADPYQIWTAAEFDAIRCNEGDWGNHFVLMADINISGYSGCGIYNIIGYSVPGKNRPFTGVFDGNGHTISNFNYTSTGKDYIGLFGYVSGENAEIKNLGLVAVDVDAGTGDSVGSLVGYLYTGIIAGCYAEGGSVSGDYSVGGLCGVNYQGTISNCYATGSVSGNSNLGGLCGFNDDMAIIANCYAAGSVSGNYYLGGLCGHNGGTISNCRAISSVSGDDQLGGLCGVNWEGSTISSCYATGSVGGRHQLGGLCGYNHSRSRISNSYATGSVSGGRYLGGLCGVNAKRGIISNCYSTGAVTGGQYSYGLGGMCGRNFGTISKCFWDKDTSGLPYSSGGRGLTTDEMKQALYYSFNGWTDGSWTIDEGNDYPHLAWENAVGEVITTPDIHFPGDGTVENPWQIDRPEDLVLVSCGSYFWGKHFVLTADIDLNGASVYPIGYDRDNEFAGSFNGGGFVISNLTLNMSGNDYVGLFGCIGGNGLIYNLGLENVSITGGSYLGGLCGYNRGTISQCYATGSVSGEDHLSGLCGRNDGTITNCYASVSVTGIGYNIGGLVGSNGGIITNCYSTGSISGTTNVGGLVGRNTGEVWDSFWDIETSGQASSDGGKGKTTDQMQMAITFTAWGVCGNEGIWTIDEGKDYPHLWWKNMPGEPISIPIPSYGGGSGEPNDPYLIYTAEHLNTIGLFPCYWDRSFKLMADIDLSGFTGDEFNIIGYYSSIAFIGVFDGNGHTISNFTYTSTGSSKIGLFSYVTGEIRDLGLIETNVNVGSYVGALVGLNYGRITNCYSTGIIKGDDYVGGLVGQNSGSGTITNCYSTASVSGTTNVGGLVGYDYYGIISNCYSVGCVLGDDDLGGLIGYNQGGKISYCFWDIETSGQTTSAGGLGRTTVQMKMAATFTCYWGNEPVWIIDEGVDYPRLVWENKPGELITVASVLYGGGTGEPEDPYLIYTAEQLNTIGLVPCHLEKHFKLMADLDLSDLTETSFNIIGERYYNDGWVENPFTGIFDGNGHTISNFTYHSNGVDYIGLFGYVSGHIKDIGLVDPNIDAGTGRYVGSLVADNCGTIANCYVEGGSVSGDDDIGGLVGYNRGTITNCYVEGVKIEGDFRVGGTVGINYRDISNCYSTASVIGGSYVGGLGGKSNGTITNCYSTGGVTGGDNVGGLVGINYWVISNCYSTGCVSGNKYVGGLVGHNDYTFWSHSYIWVCYSTGSVSGKYYVGGLLGYNEGTVWDSFWDIETSGQATSAGGKGLSTVEIQMMNTFTDAGWDFVGETLNGIEDIWFIPKQDYPHLWWEGMKVPMKLTPVSLNCRSEGNWVKAHITLPEGFAVADVDNDKPAVLHSFGFQSALPYVFVNKDKVVEIEAAFEREAVCSLAGDWPDELTVAGFLADGNIFLGNSTVRIIHPGMKVIEELANCWLQEDCIYPETDMNRDSLVNMLDYSLLMNINVEFVNE